MEQKYDLVGIDGNAFSVMGYVNQAIKETRRHQGVKSSEISDEIKCYQTAAMSSDYNNLLCVSMDKIDELNKCWEENE